MRANLAINDIVISWLSALGVALYLYYITRKPTRSFLERSTIFLLVTLLFYLVSRALYWQFSDPIFKQINFAFAALVPFSLTIFVESVLRRHSPLWFKVFVATGALLFLLLAVFSMLPDYQTVFLAFMGYVLLSVSILIILLLFRDETSLLHVENNIASSTATVLLFSAPLLVTDFMDAISLGIPVKMGAISALIFIYTRVRMTSQIGEKGIVLKESSSIIFRAILVTLCLALIFSTHNTGILIHIFAISLTFILLFMIMSRITLLNKYSNSSSFMQWLATNNNQSQDAFIDSIQQLQSLKDYIVLNEDDLNIYDIPTCINQLSACAGIVSVSDLKMLAITPDTVDVVEQLTDLLQQHQMTHVCLINKKPVKLLLFHLAQLAGGGFEELEVRIVQRFATALGDRHDP